MSALDGRYVEGHAERAAQIAMDRTARLEAELWKLKWELEQATEARDAAQGQLRQATSYQHTLGASHAALNDQHSDSVARLEKAEAGEARRGSAF